MKRNKDEFYNLLTNGYEGICDQISIAGEMGISMKQAAHYARKLVEEGKIDIYYSKDDRMGKIYKVKK
ncbi:MAG: hypothetical protein WC879_03470 [Melioribacteraceae bacterium]